MRLALVSSRERALCGFIPYPENLPRFMSSAFLSGARPSSPTSIDPDQVLKEVIFNKMRAIVQPDCYEEAPYELLCCDASKNLSVIIT